ncbi:MAG: DegT/DnrJ/EryC1/StrS family aminotransferase [Nanoarchaeota archaeon]
MIKQSVPYVNIAGQYNIFKHEILPAVYRTLQEGNYILGEEVSKFERAIASYCKTDYAIGVANGTDALRLSLRALDVGSGDEVITAPNSFIATAGAIVETGARPVFVDVRDDYNINPDLIETAITPRTKAIMPVHLTGRPAAMNEIMNIVEKHGLYVIEDAAQSIGACYHGKLTGSLGTIGCFSAHPLKTLHTLGDGGFITTNNKNLRDFISKLRNHGLKNRDEVEFFGYNSRLDEIHAAILNTQLQYVNAWNEKRRTIADYYRRELSSVVNTPQDKEYEQASYHTFIIRAEKRDELQTYLDRKDIKTKVHYPIPIHLQEAARWLGYQKGSFPIAEMQAQEILSLPVYPELTQQQIEYVAKSIKDFYQ